LQDQRFIYVGNKFWKLREFVKQDEIRNFQHSLYDFGHDLVEEGFEGTSASFNEYDEDQVSKNDIDIDEDTEEAYEDISSRMSRIDSDDEE